MHIPPKIIRGRYNIVLSPKHRQIIEKISKIEGCSFSKTIEFALEKLNEIYGG